MLWGIKRRRGERMERKRIRQLCQVGVLAAVVFAASGLRVMLPLAVGNTAIHLGNVPCLLAGLLLGGVPGGLAAGLGSAIYDLSNPVYAASAPFTFAFKFLLGWTAGRLSHRRGAEGRDWRWDLAGSVAGSAVYTCLYVAKSFFTNLWFLQMPAATAWVTVAPKLAASLVNAAAAIAIATPLALALAAALDRMPGPSA